MKRLALALGVVSISAVGAFAADLPAGTYTKAPPMVAPTYIYGLNLIGSGDWSRAAGITVSSFGATGAADITKIGILSAYDALTFVFTGSGVWSNAPAIDTNTAVGAGTIAYINGGFSTDFTVSGSWSSTSHPSAPGGAPSA